MEKKEIAIDNPISVAGLKLIPVVQILLNHWHTTGTTSFLGIKRPVAVIIVSPSAKRAFRITGEEVSMDQLTQEAPVIKEMLERL